MPAKSLVVCAGDFGAFNAALHDTTARGRQT